MSANSQHTYIDGYNMESASLMFTTPMLLITTAVLLCVYLFKYQWEKAKYPPGPFALPLLGNLLDVGKHGGILEFYQFNRQKYGDVFTVEYAGIKYVVISGFSRIHHLLVKNGNITSHRNIDLMPPSYDTQNMKSRPGIMFSPNWREMRQKAIRYLKDEGMGKTFIESRVVEEANKFCSQFIDPKLNSSLDLHKHFKLATSNVIFSLIFGTRFDYDDEQLLENNRMMEILFDSNMAAIMSKNLPLAGWLPGDPFQHRLNTRCLGATMKYFDEVVEVRRMEMAAKSNPVLFVDNYLQYFTDKDGSNVYDIDRNMASTLMQIFGGGTDTSACFMNWAILFMIVHPEIQTRVQEEIDAYVKVNNQSPTYKERSKLPYTEAVILETIRCSMMLPTLLPHRLEEEIAFDGHTIPAHTELIFNLQSVYNDPTVFEQPEVFNPDRFLTGDVHTKKSYAGIAFGLGRRSCPGEPLARMEMFLFFITILAKYRLTYAGLEPPSTTGICGTINTARPYSVICSLRTKNL